MNFHRVILCLISTMLLLGACKNEDHDQAEKKIVAKAGEEDLDEAAFAAGMMNSGVIKDSAFNAKRSIEKWAIESLFYQEAISKLGAEEIQINREVEEYRRTLVNHLYQTR